jgi:hypothetical protein
MTDQMADDTAMGERLEAIDVLSIREDVLDVLLEKVAENRYPSSTMLDHIEQLLTPWRRRDYAEILLAKVRGDKYPSLQLIRRLIRLAG